MGEHPRLEVWPDPNFDEGGWDYFWIMSDIGTAWKTLVYVRAKGVLIEKRTYDENGDDLWVVTD